MTIEPGEHSIGRVESNPYSGELREGLELGPVTRKLRLWVEDEIISLWAGSLSEERYTGKYNDVGAGSWKLEKPVELPTGEKADSYMFPGGDFDQIWHLAEAVSGSSEEASAFSEWLRQRALNLVNKDLLFWLTVEAVANELTVSRTLSYRRVRAIRQKVQEDWFAEWRETHPVFGGDLS